MGTSSSQGFHGSLPQAREQPPLRKRIFRPGLLKKKFLILYIDKNNN